MPTQPNSPAFSILGQDKPLFLRNSQGSEFCSNSPKPRPADLEVQCKVAKAGGGKTARLVKAAAQPGRRQYKAKKIVRHDDTRVIPGLGREASLPTQLVRHLVLGGRRLDST